ncbi:MAG: STAS domain-containing protein [Armatimonadota bacterium]
MRIEVHRTAEPGDVAVVKVVGGINGGDGRVDQLRVALDQVVASNVRHVLVDLTDTTMVVNRAFGQMLVALSRLRTRGGDLRVAGAQGSVLRAARTVGLHDILQLHNTTAEGIASFEGT